MGESRKEVPGRWLVVGQLLSAPTVSLLLASSVLFMGWVAWGVYYKCIIMGGRVAGICIACVQTTGSIGSPTQANIANRLELFSTEGRVGQVSLTQDLSPFF